MDSTDNEAGLQALIDTQYTLLGAEQAVYNSLQEAKASLISAATASQPNDIASQSRGGIDGSESYTYQTISQQLTESANRLKELSEELQRLMRLKNERFPWIIRG
jgi:hypothetical protein